MKLNSEQCGLEMGGLIMWPFFLIVKTTVLYNWWLVKSMDVEL